LKIREIEDLIYELIDEVLEKTTEEKIIENQTDTAHDEVICNKTHHRYLEIEIEKAVLHEMLD
jgi:hypothetical protein